MIKIHPLLRGADSSYLVYIFNYIDSSPLASGQTPAALTAPAVLVIHPLLRGADGRVHSPGRSHNDSSPSARGRLYLNHHRFCLSRFIPSCEGQTHVHLSWMSHKSIHPLLREADNTLPGYPRFCNDSSPLARGRLWHAA